MSSADSTQIGTPSVDDNTVPSMCQANDGIGTSSKLNGWLWLGGVSFVLYFLIRKIT